jgi:hypothetical protein
MCLIERGIPQLAPIGGSSFFIKYWCVSDVCPIRILLISNSIFLMKSDWEGHVWMVFLISFNFERPCFHARSHMLFKIIFVMDLAPCRVKQLSLIASSDVIAWRAFSSALSFPGICLWLGIHIKVIE